jgi:two-component system sensor histidine kinase LytS
MGLFLDLFERLGLFAILFIFLIRFKAFKRLLTGIASRRDKLVLAFMFGGAGIMATYSGFAFHGAIANLRGVAVALAGILGGPLVGLAAGLVAGIHRYAIDPSGLTSLSCGIATALQGLVAAWLYPRLRRVEYDIFAAFGVGAVNEILKMALILLLAQPFSSALHLVAVLAFPSILVNGLGNAVFVQLISTVFREQQLAKAEIRALQAQINPHFLFNAISTIISYTRTDPAIATNLLVKLAEFFRNSTATTEREVPLSVELQHCEAYLAIEQARFEERVRIHYQIDEAALDCPVPPLILQPLLENGIRHGILPRDEGGDITIQARKEQQNLHIRVADNGVGMDQAKLSGLLTPRQHPTGKEGLGIALNNVNARLVALYGRKRALRIESSPGVGTTISFSIPVAA